MADYITLDQLKQTGDKSYYTLSDLQQAQPDAPSDGVLGWLKKDLTAIPGRVGNLAAGALRGAGSIGATILSPLDAAARAANGGQPINVGGFDLLGQDRRAGMDAALQSAGADPSSLQFGVGKIGTEVLGTMGVGGALAAPVRAATALAPRAAPVLDALANGLQSGGFRIGGGLSTPATIAARVGTGAAVGGASAGLVDPSQAQTGAEIGGALPVAAQGGFKAAQVVANALRRATTPQDVKVAQQLAAQLGVTADDLTAAMTGPQLIPGYQQTVPQMVQDPLASQLQRTLQTAGHQQIADANKAQQGQFRDALGRIAPIANTVNDAGNRAGSAIQSYAIPAERAAGERVTSLFDAIPDNQATMQLPLSQMQAAQTRYLGPGTFGKGGATVEQAMQTATNIGTDPLTRIDPRAVPFSQIQALRSSIGEAIGSARTNGQNQAAAALTSMKNSIDNKVADVAAGNALPGEVFTPNAIDQWGQALDAHAAKMQQFRTGPQASMFRMGADGQPSIQGAEIPGKFFNGNQSQIEDIQAFKRLIGNQDNLAQEMKSFALTQGATTVGKSGDLAQNFIKWMNSRSGAIGGLFNDQERATVNEVGKAVQRQMLAEDLGRVSGPDTAQKLASLQSNGLLDNKLLDGAARKIPFLGRFAGAALDGLRNSANQARGGVQAGLLSDPQQFAEMLRRSPGLLNFDAAPLGLLTRGAYPALTGQ